MAEAFRTYALDTPQTARTLRARLIKMRDDLSGQVVERYAKDWPDYCSRTGVIEGITIAIGVCEEVTKEERE